MNLVFLQDFAPIGILALGAAGCVGLDLREHGSGAWGRPPSRWLALATLALAFLASVGFWRTSYGATPPDIEHGSFLIDRFALFFYAAGIAAAGAVVVCGADAEVELEPHVGVYHALLLVATGGVIFTASAADLVSLAVGLAMTAMPLSLALGLRKTDPAAMRTAVRSLTFSGLLLVVFIGGEGILAGVTGATSLSAIAGQPLPVDALLALAALLIVVGASGQIGLFPMGVWRVEEALTGPLMPAVARTVLIALAALAALVRLLPGALASAPGDWTVTVAVVAGLTMLGAPLMALRERRLVAVVHYLLIAQMALALMAMTVVAATATAGILYLSLGVVPAAAAALGLLGSFRVAGERDDPSAIRGLWARSPVLAGLLALLLAAVAGVPPLAGFFGRLFSLEAAARGGFGWLVWVALVSGVLSVAAAFRWMLLVFDSRVDGPELDLPGRTVMVGVTLCALTFLGFVVALGPLMGIAARAAVPPLFGP
ncbi:MAG: proton-conducting transporter transmembrane domain-containing protein [Candidatus Dormibacteria bacterium]